MRFSGKSAIVTGAASGIGKHLALAFAREGAAVAVADLNAVAADAVAAEIEAAGGQALGVAMDVTDERAVDAGVAVVAEAFGGVDILVSNAGVQFVHRVESFPLAEWRTVLAVHLDGAFLTTKACLKYMYAAASGSIIYMGSVHSKEASPLKAAYVTAKQRKARSTMSAPTWYARASCERRWSKGRSPNRPRNSASAKPTS